MTNYKHKKKEPKKKKTTENTNSHNVYDHEKKSLKDKYER